MIKKFISKTPDFLKNWPIEIYGLVLLLLTTFLVFLPLSGEGLSFFKNHARLVAYYFVFGGSYFLGAFVFLNLYFMAKLLSYLGQLAVKKDLIEKKVFSEKIWKLIKGQLHICLIVATGLVIMGIFASNISLLKDYSLIKDSSDLFMKWDKLVFGVYPFFSLNQIIGDGFWSGIFLKSYRILGLVLGATLFLLLAFNKKLARRFLVFFFLAFFVSLPFYFISPALSPYNMYVLNLLNIEQKNEIKFEVENFQPSGELQNYLSSINRSRDKSEGGLDLTTMPSMHVAWGFGLMIFLIRLWPALGVVAIPWFVFQMFGTSYTGQHYGVDAIGGIGVALVAFLLTKLIFIFGERHSGGAEFFPIADFIQEDLRRVRKLAARIFERLKVFLKL